MIRLKNSIPIMSLNSIFEMHYPSESKEKGNPKRKRKKKTIRLERFLIHVCFFFFFNLLYEVNLLA